MTHAFDDTRLAEIHRAQLVHVKRWQLYFVGDGNCRVKKDCTNLWANNRCSNFKPNNQSRLRTHSGPLFCHGSVVARHSFSNFTKISMSRTKATRGCSSSQHMHGGYTCGMLKPLLERAHVVILASFCIHLETLPCGIMHACQCTFNGMSNAKESTVLRSQQ